MSSSEILVRKGQSAPIEFASRLVGSYAFDALFKDGMALVEEAVAYLDGPGRAESRQLTHAGAMAYATESVRLTTRLMQLASWLLLQRAVKNGELTSEQAIVEKTKVKLGVLASAKRGRGWDDLPMRLRDLIERSSRLQARIRRLDGALGQNGAISVHSDNVVHRQINHIAEAFGAP